MNKILIVDDHPIVLKGIASMLDDEGYTLYEATTLEQAAVIYNHIQGIDLMICDLSLPTTADGIRLIEHARGTVPQMAIIVFTLHDELWNIKTIMDIGVNGIVLKGENPKELVIATDTVLNGGTYFSPQFRKMRSEVMTSSGILSRKEIEILREISFGCKNHEIAEKYNVSEKAIEYHRCSILRKFGVKTISEAVRRACEIGLLK